MILVCVLLVDLLRVLAERGAALSVCCAAKHFAISPNKIKYKYIYKSRTGIEVLSQSGVHTDLLLLVDTQSRHNLWRVPSA